jgi:hypothetical protein
MMFPGIKPVPDVSVGHPSCVGTDHFDILVRNRRHANVLAIDNYLLRDRTEALRPSFVSNLTTAANQLRPLLDGTLLSGTPSLSVLPF